MKKLVLVLAVLCPLVAAPALRAGDDGISLRTLQNGLTVVVKEDRSKPLAALRVYVRTGGAFEMEYLGCGISHYYEHLLSGGTTENVTEEESARILRELGGQNNAYTASDHTCYHVVTHRDFLPRAVALYGEWMMRNVLDPAEVEREKGVILKEINMGEDEPARVHYRLLMETMYREHPIRIPNIGFRENFARLTREDVKRYYRNHYAPNNTVVAVAGDVDAEEVFALVTEHFGGWERRPVPLVVLPEEPRQTGPRYAETEMDVSVAWVWMAYRTIDLFHEDLYALDMVSAVLSEGRSSRLFRRVVEEEGLTGAIDTSSYTPWYMDGRFAIRFQVPEEKLDRTVEVVREEIERIKAGPVTKEELERAKLLVTTSYRMNLQKVEDQAAQVGFNVMATGDPRFDMKYVERIRDVTPEEVAAAARKYLVADHLTTAVVRPRRAAGKERDAAAARKEETRTVKVVLPSGLTLLVKRIPGIDPVAVETYSLAGLRAEPAGKNGVSSLTGRLLLKGTAKRTAGDIAADIEAVGGAIGVQSGNNTIGVSITLPRGEGDLPVAAEVLADVLTSSAFPPEEFEKARTQASVAASRMGEEWQSEVILFFRAEAFGEHPYANPSLGTPESLAALTRDDVLAFAKQVLRPESTVVSIAGNVEVDRTVDLFREALAGFGGEGGAERSAPPAPAWSGGSFAEDRFAFLENDKAQAVLLLGFAGPRNTDLEDQAALLVIDAFTSGIGLPSGWFHEALRGGDRTYAYFVHFSTFPGFEGGLAWVYTQTQPDLLKEVCGLLMAQIDRLRRGDFSDEELEIGRAMALVSGPYYRQTVSDLAQGACLNELYGMGHDHEERFDAALKKVSREDVMRVVNRYFGKMLVCGTGPAEVKAVFEGLAGE